MSTDYFPPIQRAVQGLSPNTLEARRALYDKARAALLKQLRSADPALTDTQITKERLLLEDAIRRIETDMLRPETAGMASLARSAPATPSAASLQQRPVVEEPVYAEEDPSYLEEDYPHPDEAYADPEAAEPAARTGRQDQRRRATIHARRPSSDRGPLRYVLMAAAAVIVLGGVAGAVLVLQTDGDGRALRTAEQIEPAARPAEVPAAEPATPAPSGKLTDRLGAEPTTLTPAPAMPAPVAPAPVASNPAVPDPTPAPSQAAVPVDETPAPAPAAPPAAQALSPAPAEGSAAVTQHAILYEEQPDNPQRGQVFQGSIIWRTESLSAGANAPLETAVRGEVDIPERKIKATLTIRKNADPALPATHTIEIQFVVPSDSPNGGIANVPGVLMKQNAQQRGAPLQGLSVKVTSGFFLVGLSDSPTDQGRNAQLLRDRDWIDVPMLYDNGRRAILTIEKGVPGTRAFQDAFAAWDGAPTAQQ